MHWWLVMDWWLIIAFIITAALAYGYWTHDHERRHLAELFALLAPQSRGEVKPGNWLVFPQLRFELENGHYLVTAMASDGTDRGGPFTFVNLELPFDTRRKIRVKRSAGYTKRLIAGIAPGRYPTTAHKEFDEAFQIEGSDQAFVSCLLEADIRQKLLGSGMPRLDVRVEGQKISVQMDGIAKSKADLEELIDIASLLADRCPENL